MKYKILPKQSPSLFIAASFLLMATSVHAQNRRVQTTYTTEYNIPYRSTDEGDYARERCLLDFYYPENIKDFPTVVWFHGGGIEGGNKEIPAELQNNGMGVIGVGYRLLPKATVKEVIEDAAAAVAWAFREVEKRGGSTKKIFLAGHSAGGYLIDMVVLDKHYLEKFGIDADDIAGVFPYSAQIITHYNVRKQSDIGPLQPRIDDTAPIYHVRKLPMPMLVLSGDRELELYGRYEEQAYFWRMMKLNGCDQIYLYEFDGHDHNNMPGPAHTITKRFIRAISEDRPLPTR
ncbi:MAG: alpha/beta hydrolase [Bacteroidaceae bacterium]|nr:alpha/beta hydrolase [Bacteroidaceae bacterium]